MILENDNETNVYNQEGNPLYCKAAYEVRGSVTVKVLTTDEKTALREAEKYFGTVSTGCLTDVTLSPCKVKDITDGYYRIEAKATGRVEFDFITKSTNPRKVADEKLLEMSFGKVKYHSALSLAFEYQSARQEEEEFLYIAVQENAEPEKNFNDRYKLACETLGTFEEAPVKKDCDYGYEL